VTDLDDIAERDELRLYAIMFIVDLYVLLLILVLGLLWVFSLVLASNLEIVGFLLGDKVCEWLSKWFR